VYDVSIATADPKPMFNNDIAYTYKTEAEAMLQELEAKDSTIEALAQERDDAEAELHQTLDILHATEDELLAKDQTIARLQALLSTKQAIKSTTKSRSTTISNRILQRK
jgi:chromosome segregation ATPase